MSLDLNALIGEARKEAESSGTKPPPAKPSLKSRRSLCPSCTSLETYYRVTTHEFSCKRCGHVWAATLPKIGRPKRRKKNCDWFTCCRLANRILDCVAFLDSLSSADLATLIADTLGIRRPIVPRDATKLGPRPRRGNPNFAKGRPNPYRTRP